MSPEFLGMSNNLLPNNSLKIEAMAYVFPLPKRVSTSVPCLVG